MDSMSTPNKNKPLAHAPYIIIAVLAAVLVIGGALFAYEWNKLQQENKNLSNQLNTETNTTSEENEAANNTTNNSATNNAVSNTTNSTSNTTNSTGGTSGTTSQVKVFLVAVGDEGKTGTKIGCGDSLIAVTKNITPTTQPLSSALKELLAIKTRDYGESGLMTALYQSNLTVKEVSILNGKATVKLSGTVASGGVCDDPRIVEQLKATVMQFPTVKSTEITINDIALDELF